MTTRLAREGSGRLVLGFALVLPSIVFFQETPAPRPVRAEDLYDLEEIRDARVSPDGALVVFVSERAARDRNAIDADLWLAKTAAQGLPRRLTASPAGDHSPRWTPDGRRIVFVSGRSGKDQVYVLSLEGGEAIPVTSLPGGARSPVPSPADGSRVAFLGRVEPPPDGTGRERRHLGAQGEKSPGWGPGVEVTVDPEGREWAQDVRRIDRLVYRRDERFLDGSRRHLFVVPIDGGDAVRLTEGDFDVDSFAWSPDGASLVFTANRRGNPDLDRNDDLWVVSVAGGEPRLLTPNQGPDLDPTWSPDGKWIAYLGTPAVSDLKAKIEVWVVPADGGEPRSLTSGFDRIARAPEFSPDSASVLFLAADQGSVHLYSVPLAGGEVTKVVAGDREVFDFALSRRDGSTIAFAASDPMRPSEVYVASRDGSGERKITDRNRAFLSKVVLSKPEAIRVPGPGGGEVHGWVLRPPNFDPARRHPMVLWVHGGPYSAFGNGFSLDFQVLAARGFVVLTANPRLSIGYGEAWRRAANGEWGAPVLDDLHAALAHVVSLGYVDESRLGIGGGSFGGYMAAWAIGRTNRFRAAVVERCVSDLVSFWGTTDVPWFPEWEFGGLPWDNLDRFRNSSPFTFLGKAETPTLVIAAEEDTRTPPSQSEMVFAALARRGVPAELVLYPREGHGLARRGEPAHRVDRLHRIARWFERHLAEGALLKGAEAAAASGNVPPVEGGKNR